MGCVYLSYSNFENVKQQTENAVSSISTEDMVSVIKKPQAWSDKYQQITSVNMTTDVYHNLYWLT